MSQTTQTDIDQLKMEVEATLMLVKASYPASGLSPWMSVGDKREVYVRVIAKTEADLANELERQIFMLTHKGEKVPKELEPPKDSEDARFDLTKLSGGAYILGFFMNRLATNMHNYAPSVGGEYHAQAMRAAAAHRTATTPPEPKKPGFFSRILGRGKKEQ